MVDEAGRETVLRCPSLPSPYHLLAGILRWRAVGLRDRLSALRMVRPIRQAQRVALTGKGVFPASDADTVEDWLTRWGQARRLREMLWEPLALASLNQPAREAAKTICRQRYQQFGCEGQAAKVKPQTLVAVAQRYASGALAQTVV